MWLPVSATYETGDIRGFLTGRVAYRDLKHNPVGSGTNMTLRAGVVVMVIGAGLIILGLLAANLWFLAAGTVAVVIGLIIGTGHHAVRRSQVTG